MNDRPKLEFFFKGFPEDVRFRAHTVPESLRIAKGTPYEAWFNALKLSPFYSHGIDTDDWPSQLARRTFQTFGDLRDTNFDRWWVEKGYTLFAEQGDFRRIMRTDGEAKVSETSPSITLLVPLNVSPKTLKSQFAALLEEHHPHYKNFDRWEAATAPVRLTGRERLNSVSINLYLQVYSAWVKKNEFGNAFHLYDIGEELRLNPRESVHSDDGPAIVRDKHGRMSVFVSEYLQKAKKLIAHATEGRFPCLEDHHWV